MSPATSVHLDVRPMVANGQEPFATIMQALERLEPGTTLILQAPFEPVPLYDALALRGFSWERGRVADDGCELRIRPQADSGLGELDLRRASDTELEREALAAASQLGRDQTLILHSRVRPTVLLQQFDQRAFEYESEQADNNHWITSIWRLTS